MNSEDYDKYVKKLFEFKQRTEYIWYVLLKNCFNGIEETAFEEVYRKSWNKYYNIGGWDLVAEKTEQYFINNQKTKKNND